MISFVLSCAGVVATRVVERVAPSCPPLLYISKGLRTMSISEQFARPTRVSDNKTRLRAPKRGRGSLLLRSLARLTLIGYISMLFTLPALFRLCSVLSLEVPPVIRRNWMFRIVYAVFRFAWRLCAPFRQVPSSESATFVRPSKYFETKTYTPNANAATSRPVLSILTNVIGEDALKLNECRGYVPVLRGRRFVKQRRSVYTVSVAKVFRSSSPISVASSTPSRRRFGSPSSRSSTPSSRLSPWIPKRRLNSKRSRSKSLTMMLPVRSTSSAKVPAPSKGDFDEALIMGKLVNASAIRIYKAIHAEDDEELVAESTDFNDSMLGVIEQLKVSNPDILMQMLDACPGRDALYRELSATGDAEELV